MNSGSETSSGTGKSNHLIIDTGCADHIVTQKELFATCNLKASKRLKIGYSRICACASFVYVFCFDQL